METGKEGKTVKVMVGWECCGRGKAKGETERVLRDQKREKKWIRVGKRVEGKGKGDGGRWEIFGPWRRRERLYDEEGMERGQDKGRRSWDVV